MSRVPDLVRDSKLETIFHAKYTAHDYRESDSQSRKRTVVRREYWQRTECIGGGTYGQVWLERCVKGQRHVAVRAVKQIPKFGHLADAIDYNRELEAIAKFSNPRYARCFVESYGWYEQEKTLFISMEYCPHGDLRTCLQAGDRLSELETQQITFQILEGLSFLHDNAFTHRDLKPSNILVKEKPPELETWWVKIADFGISKRIEDGTAHPSTLKGTLAFMAPETHGFVSEETKGSPKDALGVQQSVDMWALGEMVYQMLTKEACFANMSLLAKYALGAAAFPSALLREQGIGDEGIDFISQAMLPSPHRRLSAYRALLHPWIAVLRPSESRPASLLSIGSLDLPDPPGMQVHQIQDEPSAKWTDAPASVLSDQSLNLAGLSEHLTVVSPPLGGTNTIHDDTPTTAQDSPADRESKTEIEPPGFAELWYKANSVSEVASKPAHEQRGPKDTETLPEGSAGGVRHQPEPMIQQLEESAELTGEASKDLHMRHGLDSAFSQWSGVSLLASPPLVSLSKPEDESGEEPEDEPSRGILGMLANDSLELVSPRFITGTPHRDQTSPSDPLLTVPEGAPQVSSAPAVPSGWQAVYSEKFQEWFYVNLTTKLSQWEKPTMQAKPTRPSSLALFSETSTASKIKDPSSSKPAGYLPGGWGLQFSETYKEWYYVNQVTKASQWERPTASAEIARPGGPGPGPESDTSASVASDTRKRVLNLSRYTDSTHASHDLQSGSAADDRISVGRGFLSWKLPVPNASHHECQHSRFTLLLCSRFDFPPRGFSIGANSTFLQRPIEFLIFLVLDPQTRSSWDASIARVLTELRAEFSPRRQPFHGVGLDSIVLCLFFVGEPFQAGIHWHSTDNMVEGLGLLTPPTSEMQARVQHGPRYGVWPRLLEYSTYGNVGTASKDTSGVYVIAFENLSPSSPRTVREWKIVIQRELNPRVTFQLDSAESMRCTLGQAWGKLSSLHTRNNPGQRDFKIHDQDSVLQMNLDGTMRRSGVRKLLSKFTPNMSSL